MAISNSGSIRNASSSLSLAPSAVASGAAIPTTSRAGARGSIMPTTRIALMRLLPLILAFTTLLILPTSILAFSNTHPSKTLSSRSSFSTSSSIFRPSIQPIVIHTSSSRRLPYPPRTSSSTSSSSSTTTSLNLLGSDSGILGIGAPEVAVILLVGYFVLGPSDLYKLVKEIGKFIQNARTLGAEAAKSFEGTMEDQLELKELRRAQSELNEAFGFRRSINTSEFGEAFDRGTGSLNSSSSGGGAAVMAAATGTAADFSTSTSSTSEGGGEEVDDDAPKRKRKLVRRKKKKVVEATEIDVPESEEGGYNNNFALEYPDLDMLDSVDNDDNDDDTLLRAQRMERLQQSSMNEDEETLDWFTASESDIASKILNPPEDSNTNSINSSFEKQRFQSQLSAEEWNAQIMAREDELSPLSMVMQRLAILDEEKRTADKRIEEEYMRRLDNEDKYYLEKRNVLLEAITDIQEGVYGGSSSSSGNEKKDGENENVGYGGVVVSAEKKREISNDDDVEDNDDNDDLTVVMTEEETNATA